MAHLEKFVDKYHGNSQTTFTLNINLGKGLRNAFAQAIIIAQKYLQTAAKKRVRINGIMTMMDVKDSKQV